MRLTPEERHIDNLFFKCVVAFGLAVLLVLTVTLSALAHGDQINQVGLSALGFCESTDDYTKEHLDTNGRMSYGRYQFQQITWDETMQKMSDFHAEDGYSYSHHIGQRPSEAPPWLQDQAVLFRWNVMGNQHAWFRCHNAAITAMQNDVGPPALIVAPIPEFTG